MFESRVSKRKYNLTSITKDFEKSSFVLQKIGGGYGPPRLRPSF